MRTLTLDKIKIELPSKWQELNLKQLRFLAKLCLLGLPEGELKLKMLLYCAGLRVRKPFLNPDYTFSYILTGKKQRFNLNKETLTELSEAFDFLFNTPEEYEEDKNTIRYLEPYGLTSNPLPSVRVCLKRLYGPGDALYNLSMNEFSLIEIYRTDYVRTANPEALNKMVSILYRKKGKEDGDKREPLTSRVANKGYWRARKLKPEDKLLIYWFYTGVMLHLRERFPRTFSGSGEASKGNLYDELSYLIDTLAGSDMTKKDKVRNGLLWDAMYSMEAAMEKAEQLYNA
jgi:hypothetical protein